MGQQKVVFLYMSKIQQLKKGARLSSKVLFSVGLPDGELAGIRDILTSGTFRRHAFESMGCWQNMGWSCRYILMELEVEWMRALMDSYAPSAPHQMDWECVFLCGSYTTEPGLGKRMEELQRWIIRENWSTGYPTGNIQSESCTRSGEERD